MSDATQPPRPSGAVPRRRPRKDAAHDARRCWRRWAFASTICAERSTTLLARARARAPAPCCCPRRRCRRRTTPRCAAVLARAAAVVRPAGAGADAAGRRLGRVERGGAHARQRDAARAAGARGDAGQRGAHRAARARAAVPDPRAPRRARRAPRSRCALADQRKDEFLATLGHELRNPLAPLLTGAAAAEDWPAPTDPVVGSRARGDGAADQPPGAAGRRPAGGLAHHPRHDRAAARAARPRVRRRARRSRPAGR